VTAPGNENYDNELGRMDFNASARHKMFFTFHRSLRANTNKVYFDNIARGGNLNRESWGGVYDDVHTFTPTFLLNTRFGWTRFVETRRVLSAGFDPTTLGLPGYIAANSRQLMLPRFDVGSFERLGENNHAVIPFDSFQVFSSATKILNRHSLKFGADLRLYRESDYEPGNAAGRYQFSTNWTRGPLDSAAASPLGQDFSAFMLGLPTGELRSHQHADKPGGLLVVVPPGRLPALQFSHAQPRHSL